MHFQYAISINILCAKLPQVRNKELVKVLIVPEGIHVTERKTKGSPVQEDVRERPNQAWIQNSPRGCLWRPASGVSTGICQWLSLNPATNLAAHCQWYTPLGIVNLPFLLCEWPQLLTYYWSPKHERREIKRITRSSTFKTHLCNCKTSWWQKCCLELFFSLTTVSTARCIMWQCNEGPGETSSWVHGNWLLNPARSVHSLSVATRWDKKYNLLYLQMLFRGEHGGCTSRDVLEGQQVWTARIAFHPLHSHPLRTSTVGLLECPLALQCWARSIVFGLSTCPKCSQPGSQQPSVPGPFMESCRGVLCPQLRLSDSSGSKISKLSLGAAHCTYSPYLSR